MTTKIEWVRGADGVAGKTWNPTTGCSQVSPGCGDETGGGCYAMAMAKRLKVMGVEAYQNDGDPATSGPGFALTLQPARLDEPLKVRKPTTWFVDSMSDLFHPDVPDEYLAEVFAVMGVASQHTFQLLTKRPQRMAKLLSSIEFQGMWFDRRDERARRDDVQRLADRGVVELALVWPIPGLWAGTSIENDRYVFRADHLRETPAALRFLSIEPFLGPVPSLDLTGISWVIVGAESGPGARPMDDDWVRDIRDRCVDRGIAFFLKQQATRTGKKISMPELDGRRWNEMPPVGVPLIRSLF